MKINEMNNFNFSFIDYLVFTFMLTMSAVIGVYFGFFSKSKNTTDEYLLGSKKLKTIPVAISLIASQLSAISIMSIPAENYSYGFNYIFLVLAIIPVIPILNYVIIPVFYENNVSNCYEMRFNRATRQIITVSYLLNGCLMLPVYMFVPSLAFSQVTGINIHVINTIVCSICVFYTMLGGIKAVVWTDVMQGGIMLVSVLLVGILGIIKVGGLTYVLELADRGDRLNFNFSLDPRIRSTFPALFSSGLFVWAGHIGLHQSCVQRIVSLPTIQHARRSMTITGIGITILMFSNAFNGIIMLAHYLDCDPIMAGLVDKADKLVPFFVQDIMGHLRGLPGLFISSVFSAALSTLSANLNSMAGVVYFDYIKPFIRHTEGRANAIMRIFVILMGIYCIAGGFIVQRFNSILQTIITITGINTGAVVGVFLLGMFAPNVNGKVAFASVIFSISTMLWIIINAQWRITAGYIKYEPLSNTLDNCDNYKFKHLIRNFSLPVENNTEVFVTTALGSNRDFSIYEISFYWYKVVGAILVWILAIPLSHIWKMSKEEKLNPLLLTPLMRKYITHPTGYEMEEIPLKKSTS